MKYFYLSLALVGGVFAPQGHPMTSHPEIHLAILCALTSTGLGALGWELPVLA